MKNVGRALFALLVLSTLVVLYQAPSASEGTAAADPTIPVITSRPAYVGAEKCKMCHLRQYNTWAATPKAKTWDRIKDAADKEKCVACHTTGYGQGGFTTFEATPNLVNIQCESCHGPGGAHVALPMSERTPAVRNATINLKEYIQDCRGCHSPHVPNKAEAVRAGTPVR